MMRSTPQRFLVAALVLTLIHGLLHLLGWRSSVMIISGTSPGSGAAILGGLLYMVSFIGLVFVAPILSIAAALLFAWRRLQAGTAETRAASLPAEPSGAGYSIECRNASSPSAVE